jgi:hypothetical protein
MLVLIVTLNVRFYFLEYAPTRVYGNPTAEVADVLCNELERREDVPPVYFDGAPYMYWDFGAIAYRVPDLTGADFDPEEGAGLVDPAHGALFVVLEPKLEDLAWIESHFPGGVVQRYTSDEDGRLLFATYELPPRRGS